MCWWHGLLAVGSKPLPCLLAPLLHPQLLSCSHSCPSQHGLGGNRNEGKNWPGKVLLHPPLASRGFFLLKRLGAALADGWEGSQGLAQPFPAPPVGWREAVGLGWHRVHLCITETSWEKFTGW